VSLNDKRGLINVLIPQLDTLLEDTENCGFYFTWTRVFPAGN
jgi:hypothetical protein